MSRFHHERVPLVILICGGSHTGKSFLATQVRDVPLSLRLSCFWCSYHSIYSEFILVKVLTRVQLAERLNLPNVLQTNLVLEFMEGMSAQGCDFVVACLFVSFFGFTAGLSVFLENLAVSRSSQYQFCIETLHLQRHYWTSSRKRQGAPLFRICLFFMASFSLSDLSFVFSAGGCRRVSSLTLRRLSLVRSASGLLYVRKMMS